MQISQKISWGFYKFKATTLIALGLRQMATAQFHQMLIDFPGDMYALSSLAFLKMESGDKKGAIADYQSIVKNSDVPAQIWYNLGFHLLHKE
jgi:tetratricopeptide (TPR) repeat protein